MRNKILSLSIIAGLCALFCIVVGLSGGSKVVDGFNNAAILISVGVLFLIISIIFPILFTGFLKELKNLTSQTSETEKKDPALSKNAELNNLHITIEENRSILKNEISELRNLIDVKSKNNTWYLDQIPIGVITVYPNGRMDKDFSESCKVLFDVEEMNEERASSFFYKEEKERAYFEEWLEILPGNSMPFKDLAGLLSTEIEIELPVVKGKRRKAKPIHLKYHFCPMGPEGDDGRVEKIVVFILDITENKKIAKLLTQKESKLEFILNVLRDRDRYIKYLEVCFHCIREVEDLVDHLLENNAHDNVTSAFRLIHTIRGNSAALGVRELKEAGTLVEDFLIMGRDGQKPIDEDYVVAFKEFLPGLKKALEDHIESSEKIFNDTFHPHKAVQKKFHVSSSYIADLENKVSEIEDADLKNKILRSLKEIECIKIETFFRHFSDTINQLAMRQKKMISPLVVFGGDTLIRPENLEPFFAAFIHLILNAVDHGIEKPEERLETGKPEEGVIKIKVQADEGELYISLEDDGRGLSEDVIAGRALQKNIITREELGSMDSNQIFNLIFKPGFSTSRRITSVSGRGIGMGAVKHEVDKLGGNIEIISKLNKGTIIKIFLPVEAY